MTPLATLYTQGLIKINEVNAGGTTGPVLWQVVVDAGTNATAPNSPSEFIFNAPTGWHDFIVTGVTATAAVLELYYRV